MIITHNLSAMTAYRHMIYNSNQVGKSLERLSSGLRINRAGDDPAGLAISERMRGQIRGLGQSIRNAQDTISLIQTADGAASSIHDMLQRAKELAIQAANGTTTDNDRKTIQTEVEQLLEQINDVANYTEFNTIKLLNGNSSKQGGSNGSNKLTMQIGAGSGQQMDLELIDLRKSTLGLDGVDLTTIEGAGAAIDTFTKAIDAVSSARGYLGARQNRLEHTISSLQNQEENLIAAESRIRDVDIAKEMMNFVKYNILTQAAQAMLAQANQQQKGILQLLRSGLSPDR